MAQILFNLSFHVLNKSLTWTHSNLPGKNTGLKNKVPNVIDSEAPTHSPAERLEIQALPIPSQFTTEVI